MKILCCGDQHLTTKKPERRLDDYYKTVLNKLQQELDIAESHGCSVVIFPGDVFDGFRENHTIAQDVMRIIDNYSGRILCIAGQHDQQFHNEELRGTTLGTLIASGHLTLLGSIPILLKECAFYGASWKEEIPEIIHPDTVNILAIHRMILGNEKLWEAQEGATWSNHLLLKTKFNLIVSGDNHQQFTTSIRRRHLVNMGSMMRSTIAQENHAPAVALYDSETKEITVIPLIVDSFSAVMNLEKIEKEKERNEKLEVFINSIKGNRKEGTALQLDFVNMLSNYVADNGIPSDIHAIIKECLED